MMTTPSSVPASCACVCVCACSCEYQTLNGEIWLWLGCFIYKKSAHLQWNCIYINSLNINLEQTTTKRQLVENSAYQYIAAQTSISLNTTQSSRPLNYKPLVHFYLFRWMNRKSKTKMSGRNTVFINKFLWLELFVCGHSVDFIYFLLIHLHNDGPPQLHGGSCTDVRKKKSRSELAYISKNVKLSLKKWQTFAAVAAV